MAAAPETLRSYSSQAGVLLDRKIAEVGGAPDMVGCHRHHQEIDHCCAVLSEPRWRDGAGEADAGRASPRWVVVAMLMLSDFAKVLLAVAASTPLSGAKVLLVVAASTPVSGAKVLLAVAASVPVGGMGTAEVRDAVVDVEEPPHALAAAEDSKGSEVSGKGREYSASAHAQPGDAARRASAAADEDGPGVDSSSRAAGGDVVEACRGEEDADVATILLLLVTRALGSVANWSDRVVVYSGALD